MPQNSISNKGVIAENSVNKLEIEGLGCSIYVKHPNNNSRAVTSCVV